MRILHECDVLLFSEGQEQSQRHTSKRSQGYTGPGMAATHTRLCVCAFDSFLLYFLLVSTGLPLRLFVAHTGPCATVVASCCPCTAALLWQGVCSDTVPLKAWPI